MNRWSRLNGLEKFLVTAGALLFITGTWTDDLMMVVQGWFIIWMSTWSVR